MDDGLSDSAALDATALSALDLAALGDSALGCAVRRVLALDPAGRGLSAADPIAAHDSHV
jgi:hypothetical protein